MKIYKAYIVLAVLLLLVVASCSDKRMKENQEKMVGEWQSVQNRITLTIFRVDETYFIEFCKRHLNKEKHETYRIRFKKNNLFIDDRFSTPIFYDCENDRIISFPYGEYYRIIH